MADYYSQYQEKLQSAFWGWVLLEFSLSVNFVLLQAINPPGPRLNWLCGTLGLLQLIAVYKFSILLLELMAQNRQATSAAEQK